MAFTEEQTKALSAKLNGRHVRTRVKDGVELSYVEGWHAIAEANRVFGYDAWDRHTVMSKCVSESVRGGWHTCAYIARVRIKVRAGETIVCREGTGSGSGTAESLAEAHELAIKEAETDAMKRALVTFGNPFGLALYDREQSMVRKSTPRPVVWQVYSGEGEPVSKHQDPIAFCSSLKLSIEGFTEHQSLMAFWRWNRDSVVRLKRDIPDLKTEQGQHYGDILSNLYTKRLQEFVRHRQNEEAPSPTREMPDVPTSDISQRDSDDHEPQESGASATVIQATYVRSSDMVRSRDHLAFVASHACLVCEQLPSEAHHVKYAQPRALGRKVSDEFTVPLCAVHHRELHNFGNERAWWRDKAADPLKEAQELWRRTCELKKAG